MIPNGRYEKRTASESEETETDRMVALCHRDLMRGMEEDRFEVETPRGHVEQDGLRNLKINIRYPTEQHWTADGPKMVTGPPLLGLEFSLSINHEGVTGDLSSFDTDVVVYGDQHVWRLTDPWEEEVALDGFAVGDEAVYDHEHWWGTVEEIDFRG